MSESTPPSTPSTTGKKPSAKEVHLPFSGAGLLVGIILSPMLVMWNFGKLFRLYSMVPLIRIGIILVLLGVPVLFVNELYMAHKAALLGNMQNEIVDASADKVDPANEGKLVHITGTAIAKAPVVDADTGVSAPAVRLVRKVEMFQWKENKGKPASGNTPATPSTYDKIWSEKPINSESFQDKSRENPRMTLQSKAIAAQPVTVGAFTLSDALVSQIDATTPLDWTPQLKDALPEAMRALAKIDGPNLYLGDPLAPRIGDIRINYTLAQSGPVSILAGQHGGTLQTYTSANGEMEVLKPGTFDAATLIGQAQSNIEKLTWIGRSIGFLIILGGFTLFFFHTAMIMSLMEYTGNLFTLGRHSLTFILSTLLSALVIGAGWGIMHPGLGTGALILVVLIVICGIMMARRMPALYKAWSDSIETDEAKAAK